MREPVLSGERLRRFGMSAVYSAYVLMILLYIFSSPPFICISTLLCAAAHEACHVLCAKALGRKTAVFSFSVTGLYPDLGYGSALSCIAIYAAGPLFNILMCILCVLLYPSYPSQYTVELFSVNCVLGVFNLLPVPFSDGDGILRILLPHIFGSGAGTRICAAVECVFSFCLFVFFSYRFFLLGRGLFSFFCSVVFLICSLGRIA